MIRFSKRILVFTSLCLAVGTNYTTANPLPKEQLDFHGKVANHFRIGDLLFVYQNPLLPAFKDPKSDPDDSRYKSSSTPNGKNSKAIEEIRATELAFPDPSIEDMISKALEIEHDLRLEKATLFKQRSEAGFWCINWNLFPTEGGHTGQPWSYLGIVSGNGKLIAPEVSLWSAFPIHGDNRFIRSQLKLNNLLSVEDKKHLFGDEIAILAKERLDGFTKKQGLKTTGDAYAEHEAKYGPLQWRLQSQRLLYINGHVDGRRIWKVEFADESWGAENAIDLRVLTLWISLTGEVSELSLGTEEIR